MVLVPSTRRLFKEHFDNSIADSEIITLVNEVRRLFKKLYFIPSSTSTCKSSEISAESSLDCAFLFVLLGIVNSRVKGGDDDITYKQVTKTAALHYLLMDW